MQTDIILQHITREELFSKISEIVSLELNKKLQPEAVQEYLTKQEVATKLRSSLPTVQRLTKEGTITGYRIGRRLLYKSGEIDLALKQIDTRKYKRG